MKQFWLLFSIIALYSFCPKPQKTAEEVYTSGKVDNIQYFSIIKADSLKGVDYYKYKQDTALLLEIHYWDYQAKKVIGYAFYYKGKPEGKWIMYNQEGKRFSEENFKNGKHDGFSFGYDSFSGYIKSKTFYQKDLLLYEVTYDENGKTIDSNYVKSEQ